MASTPDARAGRCSLCGRAITEQDEQKMFVDGGRVSLRICAGCLAETARENFFRALRAAGLEYDRAQIETSAEASDRYSLNFTKGNRRCGISNVRASILENEGDPKLERLIREIASFLNPKWPGWESD